MILTYSTGPEDVTSVYIPHTLQLSPLINTELRGGPSVLGVYTTTVRLRVVYRVYSYNFYTMYCEEVKRRPLMVPWQQQQ